MGALLQGPRLRFYINNRLFDATVDPSIQEGSISLFIDVPKQTEYTFYFDRFFVLVP